MSITVTHLPNETLGLVNEIKTKYLNTGLKYGWKSTNNLVYDTGHWNKLILNNSQMFPYDQSEMPFIKYHPEIELLWNILKINLGDKKLLRVYINGYTYGTDAYAHQDDIWIDEKYGKGSSGETILLYLNDVWDLNWAGETVVFNDQNEIEFSMLPKKLRVISFPSQKFHAARPVSRGCPVLRSVLVFKTFNNNITHTGVDFLLRKTKGLSHSGKTFFEHLYNTACILENEKYTEDVCNAGLFHSIYGTEFYKFNDPDITRKCIRDMIGDYSESLVYEFCSLQDRKTTLIENKKNYDLNFRNDLIKIEIANLKEQNNHRQYSTDITQLIDCLSSQGNVK
jgi:hypothetical protein